MDHRHVFICVILTTNKTKTSFDFLFSSLFSTSLHTSVSSRCVRQLCICFLRNWNFYIVKQGEFTILYVLYFLFLFFALKQLFLPRLQHIDEVLRSARLSGYLHIRTVLIFKPCINLFFWRCLIIILPNKLALMCFLSFSVEMVSTSGRARTYRWYWSRWSASTLCRSPWSMFILIFVVYR